MIEFKRITRDDVSKAPWIKKILNQFSEGVNYAPENISLENLSKIFNEDPIAIDMMGLLETCGSQYKEISVWKLPYIDNYHIGEQVAMSFAYHKKWHLVITPGSQFIANVIFDTTDPDILQICIWDLNESR